MPALSVFCGVLSPKILEMVLPVGGKRYFIVFFVLEGEFSHHTK
jgi:hypothetical protein